MGERSEKEETCLCLVSIEKRNNTAGSNVFFFSLKKRLSDTKKKRCHQNTMKRSPPFAPFGVGHRGTYGIFVTLLAGGSPVRPYGLCPGAPSDAQRRGLALLLTGDSSLPRAAGEGDGRGTDARTGPPTTVMLVAPLPLLVLLPASPLLAAATPSCVEMRFGSEAAAAAPAAECSLRDARSCGEGVEAAPAAPAQAAADPEARRCGRCSGSQLAAPSAWLQCAARCAAPAAAAGDSDRRVRTVCWPGGGGDARTFGSPPQTRVGVVGGRARRRPDSAGDAERERARVASVDGSQHAAGSSVKRLRRCSDGLRGGGAATSKGLAWRARPNGSAAAAEAASTDADRRGRSSDEDPPDAERRADDAGVGGRGGVAQADEVERRRAEGDGGAGVAAGATAGAGAGAGSVLPATEAHEARCVRLPRRRQWISTRAASTAEGTP
eukprot:Rhum_TRINITY_DN13085_c0_g2::Rhum_TRINITY_DN13085_c0_g2_i1::g.56877::m.56877